MHACILLLLALQVAATFAQVSFVVLTSLPPAPAGAATHLHLPSFVVRTVYRCSIAFLMDLLGGSIEKLAALLALAGGAANATITFILPSLFYLVHRWSSISRPRLCVTVTVIVAAAFAAVIATVFAAQDLWASGGDGE